MNGNNFAKQTDHCNIGLPYLQISFNLIRVVILSGTGMSGHNFHLILFEEKLLKTNRLTDRQIH